MRAAAVWVAFLACMVCGCQAYRDGYPQQPIPRPSAVLDFATLYGQNCAACHGSDGAEGPATDLANPEYEALVDDASLRKWIGGGMPGTQMPAFATASGGMLTDAQVNAIIEGMRKRWLRAGAFEGAQPPAYGQTQLGDAKRGAGIYQARCADCHKGGRGDITDPGYLALGSDQALRSLTVAGSPDVGQPDWRHDSPDGKPAAPLTEQEINDIIAYLDGLRTASPGFAGNAAEPHAGAQSR